MCTGLLGVDGLIPRNDYATINYNVISCLKGSNTWCRDLDDRGSMTSACEDRIVFRRMLQPAGLGPRSLIRHRLLPIQYTQKGIAYEQRNIVGLFDVESTSGLLCIYYGLECRHVCEFIHPFAFVCCIQISEHIANNHIIRWPYPN